MRRRGWQRIIAFAASAAVVMSNSGMQTLINEIGKVHAEELDEIILEEEWSDSIFSDESGNDSDIIFEEDAIEEISVLTADSEEPLLLIEDIEIEGIEEASYEEATLATGGDAAAQLDASTGTVSADAQNNGETASDADESPMLVEVKLAKSDEQKDADASDFVEQGEAQWIHVSASDLASDSEGETDIRVYLINKETKEPATDIEVLLFEEYKEDLSNQSAKWPVVLEDALDGKKDLSVDFVQEYEEDENGEYVKAEDGTYIVEKEYLEFTLPSGSTAEFEAAFLYTTSDTEYQYKL